MFITILTPSYNRSHTLEKLYESLENQSNKEFLWLIVDDGSTDDTEGLVRNISEKASINIKYLYKDNGGKHTAINEGVNAIESPLTFVVDSDDYLTEDAIQTIYEKWKKYEKCNNIGSFWFLQSDSYGNIIGDKFPHDEFVSTYTEIMINGGICGDKKSVYYTDLRKSNPFPVFNGEKFIGESTIHKRIGNTYKSVFINKLIYKGDYLQDGLSKAGFKMRISNPLGGMANAKEFMAKEVIFKIRLKKTILFIAYGFFANIKISKIISESGDPFFVTSCIPLGYILYKRWSQLQSEE